MHKSPWELPYIKSNTKKSYDGKIRGQIRRNVWNKNEVRLAFVNSRPKKRMLNKNTGRMCIHSLCAICKEWIDNPDKKMEVDHITPMTGWDSLEDIYQYTVDLCYVSKEDLQHLCKPCHKIKTLADGRGISFEDARIEKEVIKVMNLKAAPLKKWLAKRNISYITPAKKNEDAVRDVVIEEASSYGKGG